MRVCMAKKNNVFWGECGKTCNLSTLKYVNVWVCDIIMVMSKAFVFLIVHKRIKKNKLAVIEVWVLRSSFSPGANYNVNDAINSHTFVKETRPRCEDSECEIIVPEFGWHIVRRVFFVFCSTRVANMCARRHVRNPSCTRRWRWRNIVRLVLCDPDKLGVNIPRRETNQIVDQNPLSCNTFGFSQSIYSYNCDYNQINESVHFLRWPVE